MTIQVGSKVWVYAMGSYYAGQVLGFTEKMVKVEYTSGTGKTRTKKLRKQPDGSYCQDYCSGFPLVPIVEGEPKPKGCR